MNFTESLLIGCFLLDEAGSQGSACPEVQLLCRARVVNSASAAHVLPTGGLRRGRPPSPKMPSDQMKNLLIGLLIGALWLASPTAWACRVCRPRVQATIHTPDYAGTLAVLLLPIGLLLVGGLGLYFATTIKRYFSYFTRPWLSTTSELPY